MAIVYKLSTACRIPLVRYNRTRGRGCPPSAPVHDQLRSSCSLLQMPEIHPCHWCRPNEHLIKLTIFSFVGATRDTFQWFFVQLEKVFFFIYSNKIVKYSSFKRVQYNAITSPSSKTYLRRVWSWSMRASVIHTISSDLTLATTWDAMQVPF